MRYTISLHGHVIGETEHADLAVGGAQSFNSVPITVTDSWTGADVPFMVGRPTKAVSPDNPHGLPLHYIRDELRATGRKIAMIKLVREISGLGLAEAKAVVDRLDMQI